MIERKIQCDHHAAALTFIDSATLRILAKTQELLTCRGCHLAIRSPSRLAALVLGVFELAALIEVADSAPVVSLDSTPAVGPQAA